jgi:hypothetical protein
LRHDKALLFAVLVLAALGVRAYGQTPESIFPNMSFSRVEGLGRILVAGGSSLEAMTPSPTCHGD